MPGGHAAATARPLPAPGVISATGPTGDPPMTPRAGAPPQVPAQDAAAPIRASREALHFTAASAALLLLGIGLGNAGLLILAPFPLFTLLLLRREQPPAPRITTRLSTLTPRRGEVVTVDVHAAIPPGRGMVEVHVPVPDAFELEAGSNLHVLPADPEGRGYALKFRIRATTRGKHTMPAAGYARIHACGFTDALTGTDGEARTLDVLPVVKVPRRRAGLMKASRDQGRDTRAATAATGGSDFSEIREYRHGDPIKRINWKATARRLASGSGERPVVNEYEREGKTPVWILVDLGERRAVGTTVDHAVEHAIEAASTLAAHFLGKGIPVGGLAYHARHAHPLAPDTGNEHAARFARALARAEPAAAEDASALDLQQALAMSHGHVAKGGAQVIILTRIEGTGDDVAPAMPAARRLTPRRGKPIVVDVRPWGLEPDLPEQGRTAAMMDAFDRPGRARVRAQRASVVPWLPAEETASVLVTRIRGRIG